MKQCPNCKSMVDDSIVRCTVCGSVFPVTATYASQSVEIPQQYSSQPYTASASPEANLLINFTTNFPNVGMVSRIVSTGQVERYDSGSTIGFLLAPGPYLIVLKIGNINYNRNIYVPADGGVVKIFGSYDGRAHIKIDQPSYTPIQPSTDNYVMSSGLGETVSADPERYKRTNGLAIASMVCGILGLGFATIPYFGIFYCILVILMSIGALCMYNTHRRSGMAIAGIITSIIGLILALYLNISVYDF